MSQTCTSGFYSPNTLKVKEMDRQLNWMFEEIKIGHNSVRLWQNYQTLAGPHSKLVFETANTLIVMAPDGQN